MKTHRALYGKTAIRRGYCGKCHTWAFVIDGVVQCCNSEADAPSGDGLRRMAENPEDRRSVLTKADKAAILQRQGGACIYCGAIFDSYLWDSKRVGYFKVQVEFDHFVPWCNSQDGRCENMVAACSACNKAKSGLVFNTIDEVKVYLATARGVPIDKI